MIHELSGEESSATPHRVRSAGSIPRKKTQNLPRQGKRISVFPRKGPRGHGLFQIVAEQKSPLPWYNTYSTPPHSTLHTKNSRTPFLSEARFGNGSRAAAWVD